MDIDGNNEITIEEILQALKDFHETQRAMQVIADIGEPKPKYSGWIADELVAQAVLNPRGLKKIKKI